MNDQLAPRTKTIFILGIESNGDLIMSDGGETCVGRSDTIFWDIFPGAEVEEITDIQKKPGSSNVFGEEPAKQTGKKWRGKIKDQFGIDEKTVEEYSIYYITTKGIKGIYDPIIKVNS